MGAKKLFGIETSTEGQKCGIHQKDRTKNSHILELTHHILSNQQHLWYCLDCDLWFVAPKLFLIGDSIFLKPGME